MNTSLTDKLARLVNPENDQLEVFELNKKVLSARFLSEIQKRLDNESISRKDFAKKIGVSASFLSQLYNGDKLVSIDFLVKAQEVMNFTFLVSVFDTFDGFNENVKGHNNQFDEYLRLNDIGYNEDENEDGFWVFHTRSSDNINYSKVDKSLFKHRKLSVA